MATPGQFVPGEHPRDPNTGEFAAKQTVEADGGTESLAANDRGLGLRYSETHSEPPVPGHINSGVRGAILRHWRNTDGFGRLDAARFLERQAAEARSVVQFDYVMREFEEQSDHSIHKIVVEPTYDRDGAPYALSSFEDETGAVHETDAGPGSPADKLDDLIIESGLLDDDEWRHTDTTAFGLTMEEKS